MSLGEQFQVTLPSNVKGNDKNKPGLYETTLATPLDLNGEWEVAIMDLSYQHKWVNLKNKFCMSVLTIINDEESRFKQNVTGNQDTQALINGMVDVENFAMQTGSDNVQIVRFYTRNTFTIVPGQYDIRTLLHTIQNEITKVGFGLTYTRVEYNDDSKRISITEPSRVSILASYKENSLLRLLGFEKDLKTTTGPRYSVENEILDPLDPDDIERLPQSRPEIDYLMLSVTAPAVANLPPLIKPINSIFVYTDIVEYALVGDTQAPLLNYFPVQSEWGQQAHWVFNPAYYLRVKEQNIRTLTIKLCNDLGEVIDFEGNANVICRLHFRRIR